MCTLVQDPCVGQGEESITTERAVDPTSMLPPATLGEVLRHGVQWSARATCRAFCDEGDAGRESLRIDWCAAGTAQYRKLWGLLSRLPRLRSLDAIGCPLHHLGTIALPGLTSIKLNLAEGIMSLQPLSACVALQALELLDCRGLVDIHALRACRKLTSLTINNSGISDIGSLSACLALTSLRLDNCHHLADIGPLTSTLP